MQTSVLSSCYFPPAVWFQEFLKSENAIIDIHEHYSKQTWRNRCTIITANGLMNLIIPVKTQGNHTPVNAVLIDYSTNWQRIHRHAIRSAYGNSPYFEYYSDEIEKLYTSQPAALISWNQHCFEITARILKIKSQAKYSDQYIEPDSSFSDFRCVRNNVLPEIYPVYTQIFQERHGFIPGLSILDLLFCCGPHSLKKLQENL